MSADSVDALTEGKRLLREKNYAAAQVALARASFAAPENRDARYLLAMCLFRLERYDQAEKEYLQLVRQNPRDALSSYGLGVSLEKLARLPEAELAMMGALAADPSFEKAAAKLAEYRRPAARSVGRPAETHHRPVDHRGVVLPAGGAGAAASSRPSAPNGSNVAGPREARPAAGGAGAGAAASAVPNSASRGIDEDIKAGDTGPGALLFDGGRLLRSYLGRLMLAAIFVVAGGLPLWHVVSLDRVAVDMAQVANAQAGLDDAIARGLPDVAVQIYRSGLGRAQALEAWINGLIDFGTLGLVVLGMFIAFTAVIGTATTHYRFYAKRVDLTEGLLFRRTKKVWLYEVTDLEIQQPITLLLGGTARLKFLVDNPEMSRITVYTARRILATGFGSVGQMEREADELRSRVLAQRRAIKATWV